MKDENRYNKWTIFLEEYKDYLKNDEEIWNDKLEELKKFINNNNKKPSTISKNEIEKINGDWLSCQQHNYRNKKEGMKDENRYNKWAIFSEEYKDYLKNDEEIWNDKLEELKKFINNNNKKPSTISKNEIEKINGHWLSNQQSNYKNKKDGMTDENRYNKWTIFLEEYKKYFIDVINTTNSNDIISLTDSKKQIIKSKKSMELSKKKSIKNQETIEQKGIRIKSEISQLHQKYKTMRSGNLNKEFQDNPDLWFKYHEIAEENDKSFPEEEIPRNCIIKELDNKLSHGYILPF
jgi:hypothetical protein